MSDPRDLVRTIIDQRRRDLLAVGQRPTRPPPPPMPQAQEPATSQGERAEFAQTSGESEVTIYQSSLRTAVVAQPTISTNWVRSEKQGTNSAPHFTEIGGPTPQESSADDIQPPSPRIVGGGAGASYPSTSY